MQHIYFLAKDVIDSELVTLGDINEGCVELNEEINVPAYDLLKFNGDTSDLDGMIVDIDYNKEDSPASPYTAEDNEFYRNNKEFFVDSDIDHSPREMVEILLEVAKTKPMDSITKDDIKESLEAIRAAFRNSRTK